MKNFHLTTFFSFSNVNMYSQKEKAVWSKSKARRYFPPSAG